MVEPARFKWLNAHDSDLTSLQGSFSKKNFPISLSAMPKQQISELSFTVLFTTNVNNIWFPLSHSSTHTLNNWLAILLVSAVLACMLLKMRTYFRTELLVYELI